jgi:hypothetical protein
VRLLDASPQVDRRRPGLGQTCGVSAYGLHSGAVRTRRQGDSERTGGAERL